MKSRYSHTLGLGTDQAVFFICYGNGTLPGASGELWDGRRFSKAPRVLLPALPPASHCTQVLCPILDKSFQASQSAKGTDHHQRYSTHSVPELGVNESPTFTKASTLCISATNSGQGLSPPCPTPDSAGCLPLSLPMPVPRPPPGTGRWVVAGLGRDGNGSWWPGAPGSRRWPGIPRHKRLLQTGPREC